MKEPNYGFLGAIVLLLIALAIATSLILLPIAFIAGLIYVALIKYTNLIPSGEEAAQKRTLEMYERVLSQTRLTEIEWNLPYRLEQVAEDIIAFEELNPEIDPPPSICNSIEGARYRDYLSKMGGLNQSRLDDIQAAIEEALSPFSDIQAKRHSPNRVVAQYLIPNIPQSIVNTTAPFVGNDLFPQMQKRLRRRQEEQEGIPPSKYKGEDVIDAYLGGTPLAQLYQSKLAFDIEDKYRFQHQFILGGTGHGKTQCIQQFIAEDIEKVIKREASLIVIDSQGDLINTVRQLEGLTPENTVIIDPEDVEYPVSLNLFDIKQDRLDGYGQLARERQLNGIIELYDYVLGSLLSAEMTQKQQVVFRYVTRLLLLVPGATIHTMLELFQDGGIDRYETYINQLDPVAQSFFQREFKGKEFNQTRQQVVRRLYGILENQAFNRMFSHPESKLDLFTEMNAGKLILINTAKSLLKEEGTEILGRFFIAMITQAAQEREEIDAKDRLPCFVYIDEANDYRFDAKIDTILTQARKYGVGLCMATQYLDKISQQLQSAIAANTVIKFAGGVSNRDARRMAPDMRCTPEFIENQPPLTFAVHVRGLTHQALPLSIRPGFLEEMPKASMEQQETLRAAMRNKYSEPVSKTKVETPTPSSPDDVEETGEW